MAPGAKRRWFRRRSILYWLVVLVVWITSVALSQALDRQDRQLAATLEGCPWLSVTASDRRGATERTMTAVAEWLDVEPDSFDLEVD